MKKLENLQRIITMKIPDVSSPKDWERLSELFGKKSEAGKILTGMKDGEI